MSALLDKSGGASSQWSDQLTSSLLPTPTLALAIGVANMALGVACLLLALLGACCRSCYRTFCGCCSGCGCSTCCSSCCGGSRDENAVIRGMGPPAVRRGARGAEGTPSRRGEAEAERSVCDGLCSDAGSDGYSSPGEHEQLSMVVE